MVMNDWDTLKDLDIVNKNNIKIQLLFLAQTHSLVKYIEVDSN